MTVTYSEKAIQDINLIFDYLIFEFGAKVAEEKVNKIHGDIAILEENPFFGRAIFDNMRKLISGVSAIIYEVTSDTVEIYRVFDARSDYMRTIFGN